MTHIAPPRKISPSVFSRDNWFFSRLIGQWRSYMDVIVASFFINLLAIAIPMYSMTIYDRVLPHMAYDTLHVLLIGVIFALSFDLLFRILRARILDHAAQRVSQDLEIALMKDMIHETIATRGLSTGAKTNLFRELQSIKEFYASRVAPSLLDMPFFFMFLIFTMMIAPILALVPLVCGGLLILVHYVIQKMIWSMNKELFHGMQQRSDVMIDFLQGSETIRLFGKIEEKLNSWSKTVTQTSNIQSQTQFLNSVAQSASLFLTYLANIFVLYIGVYEVQAGNLTFGMLIAATILSSRAMAPIMAFSGVISQLRQSEESLRVLHGIFSSTDPATPKFYAAVHTKSLRGNIQIDHVMLSYEGAQKPALTDVTITLPFGSKVGIIGRSGSGKSTLLRALYGQIAPQQGRILYGNYDISELDPTYLPKIFSVIPQDIKLLRGTLKDNLFSDHHALQNSEDILDATGVSDLMKQSGRGIDTLISERGMNLSGGQRQSIAIARCLLKNTDFYFMDEPTSALDTQLEQKVLSFLGPFLKEKTLFLITHRLPLLQLVDHILLLDDGRPVLFGPKEQVMKQLSQQGSHA
jgi:ATP-binding cassette subfamily C protein LapB